MSRKFLFTGFKPYSRFKHNPSEKLIKIISSNRTELEKEFGVKIFSHVLDVSYKESEKEISELIERVAPDFIVSFGMAPKARKIMIERVALNLDDCKRRDKSGEVRLGKEIVSLAPAAFFSQLPIQELLRTFLKEGISAEISNHAGTYICNHVFYFAIYKTKSLGLKTKVGFIHLPKIVSKNTLLKIGKICIDVCLKFS